MEGIKAWQFRRALQEEIKAQPSFNDTVMDAVAQEQENVEATVVVTKRYERGGLGPITPVSHTDGFEKGTHPGRGLLETKCLHPNRIWLTPLRVRIHCGGTRRRTRSAGGVAAFDM